MPKFSDESEEAQAVAVEQAARLRRLRERFGPVGPAHAAAGISRDAWGRMERGETRIDAVALARWATHHGVSPEYVLTGGLSGLPGDLARELVQVELRDALEASRTAYSPASEHQDTPEPCGNPGSATPRGRRVGG